MKKEGIQTRNRKIATKAKKKRGSVVDFFAPFEKSFGYVNPPNPAAAAATGYHLANQMTQYYNASQFMTDFAGAAMYGAADHLTAAVTAAVAHDDLIPSSSKPDLASSHHVAGVTVGHSTHQSHPTSSRSPQVGGSNDHHPHSQLGHIVHDPPSYSLAAAAAASQDILVGGMCKPPCIDTSGSNPVSAMT